MPDCTAKTAPALRRRLFLAVAAFVFLWMLLLNFLTPWIADDFTFAFAFSFTFGFAFVFTVS